MKENIIKLNVPTSNGVMYTTEEMQKAIDAKYHDIRNGLFGCFDTNTPNFSLDQVSHVVHNLSIKDDILVAEFEILNTPNGKMVEYIYDSIRLTLSCFGVVQSDKTVKDIDIHSVYFVKREDHTQNDILEK